MKSSQSPTEFEQNNHEVTSILGCVIKKNSSRGAKHGPFERQRMYYQAKQMLKTAREKKHGRHPTILARWYASESYRTLSTIGWKEKHIMLYDWIALEKHFYVATRVERNQSSKHWILTLGKEGPQQPLIQRLDFAQAKRECKRLHDEHLARTQEECRTIPRSHQSGEGWYFGGIEVLAIRFWKGFSNIWNDGREDCFCSEQDHPEFSIQEEGPSRGTESPERGPVSARKTDRLHDLRLLLSDWRSWHNTRLCSFILCYSSWWWYSGIRDKMEWSSTLYVKDSIRWYLAKSVQTENTWVRATPNCFWNCTTWRFIRRYRCPIIKNWRL